MRSRKRDGTLKVKEMSSVHSIPLSKRVLSNESCVWAGQRLLEPNGGPKV